MRTFVISGLMAAAAVLAVGVAARVRPDDSAGPAASEWSPPTTLAMPTTPIDPAVHMTIDLDAPDETRERLIDIIWNGQRPPTRASTIADIHGAPGPVGFAIVHHGHIPADMGGVSEALIASGFAVVELQMPADETGSSASHVHDVMFDEIGTEALRLFLDPTIETLNLFDQIDPTLPVVMVGLSGGGWTTHLAAAIDERIDVSIPVAGALPLWVRPYSLGSQGDAEQTWPAVYDHVTYLDIFALATTNGRRQVQVLNLHDSCCFGGHAHELYSGWLDDRLPSWSIFVDASHDDHIISPVVVDLVTRTAADLVAAQNHPSAAAAAAMSRMVSSPVLSEMFRSKNAT